MNPLSKAFGFMRAMWTFARYEAGLRYNPRRTFLPGFVQDAHIDADQCTRMELVRKSRWFEKNDALANRIAEVYTEFTVGAFGPTVSPESSDEDWNLRASDWLDEWSQVADLNSKFGYGGLMTTACWREFFDGEFFLLKTGERGRPRLQGISAHRVATPPDLYDQEGSTIIDGVRIDKRGRPISYFIQEGFDDERFTERTANEVIHLFEPSAPNQYRGLPKLTPVMNLLHDWNDLCMFEMQKAKDNAQITNIWENATGSFSPQQARQNRFLPTQTAPTDSIDSQRYEFIKRVLGPKSVAVKSGEKILQLKNESPSAATQWLWDYMASLICAGVGVSKLLVFPWSLQGTVARSELDLATNYFRSRFATFARASFEVYLFAMGTARFSDVRVADAPFDWTRIEVLPPRAPNVDVGRNSAAMIAELESGATTLKDIYLPRNQSWRKQIDQRGREEQVIDITAKKYGLTPDRIRRAIAESMKAQMAAETEKQRQEDLQPA
ncbi:MAG TPA: phage portal protein [Verrucomicrobiae bacterium]|nr:phage portal protein [Verrucomicrobiae bacterium]